MKLIFIFIKFSIAWLCADGKYRAISTKNFQNQLQLSKIVKKSCGMYSEYGVTCRGFGPVVGVYHRGGCTAPEPLDILADRWFLAACKTHDVCYSLQKQSRQICDAQFYFNMEYSCVNLPKYVKIACDSTRAMIYSLVEKFGHEFYERSSRDCKVKL